MKKLLVLIFLFLTITAHADNQSPYPFTSTNDANRFTALTKEIRCVVCQNQNIADSNAPLANDLRDKIYHLVLEKKSDTEIKNYLVKRYGEFILLRPLFNKITVVLWIFPFFCLAFILVIIYRMAAKRPRS